MNCSPIGKPGPGDNTNGTVGRNAGMLIPLEDYAQSSTFDISLHGTIRKPAINPAITFHSGNTQVADYTKSIKVSDRSIDGGSRKIRGSVQIRPTESKLAFGQEAKRARPPALYSDFGQCLNVAGDKILKNSKDKNLAALYKNSVRHSKYDL